MLMNFLPLGISAACCSPQGSEQCEARGPGSLTVAQPGGEPGWEKPQEGAPIVCFPGREIVQRGYTPA